MDFFVQNISLTLFFPMWVTLLILIGKFTGILKSKKTILALTLLSSVWGVISSSFVLAKVLLTPNFTYETVINFLNVKGVAFDLGCYVDLISAFLMLIVFAVSLIVQIYAYYYMYEDKSFVRFFTFFNFFTFTMIGLVLAPNIFQTYVFWELIGVSSYLLIGFWYKKDSAQKAAKKAFLMNRIGDTLLLAGIIFSSVLMYNFASDSSFVAIPYSSLDEISSILYTYTTETTFAIICVMLFFGSIAKSAQFPLHTWLVDAMEGPTPVSALIHSATMVAAGVFLVARLYPIYFQSTFAMNFIIAIGLITAILCAYFAMTCDDVKKILAYSTSSQLGIMFVALGSGALTGGVVYLCSHAFIKSMLFLCAGAIITAFAGNANIHKMGGLRKKSPILATCFIIGALSLCGLMFSGFVSKSLIIHQLFETSNYLILSLLILVSFMTAYYIFRLYFIVFEGKTEASENAQKVSKGLIIPTILMTFFIVILGFFFPHLNDIKTEILPVIIELLGLITAFVLFRKSNNLIKLPILYNLSYNALYIDNFYNYLAKNIYSSITETFNFIETYVYDGFVAVIVFLVKLKSWVCSKLQTGNIQSYISYSFLILAALFTIFCVVYSLVAYFVEV